MRYCYFDDTDFVVVFVNLDDQLAVGLLVVEDYCFDFVVATEDLINTNISKKKTLKVPRVPKLRHKWKPKIQVM